MEELQRFLLLNVEDPHVAINRRHPIIEKTPQALHVLRRYFTAIVDVNYRVPIIEKNIANIKKKLKIYEVGRDHVERFSDAMLILDNVGCKEYVEDCEKRVLRTCDMEYAAIKVKNGFLALEMRARGRPLEEVKTPLRVKKAIVVAKCRVGWWILRSGLVSVMKGMVMITCFALPLIILNEVGGPSILLRGVEVVLPTTPIVSKKSAFELIKEIIA